MKWKVYYAFKLVLPIYRYKYTNKSPVFLIFTPEHANLGDHAIAYAEQKMLHQLGIDFYEITGKNLYTLEQYGYLNILNGSLILVSGGGNLGTLWPDIEKMNRCIIQRNLDSIILVLPNSIFYENTTEGQLQFGESKRIYNSHNNLYLYAREKLSYEVMRNAYNNVKLAPDMVLTLNETCERQERKGCILCLRRDVERTLSDRDEKYIEDVTAKMFNENVKISDTVLEHNVSINERKQELIKKFDEFREAELVITDRLHGMIFCAITGTNCIVLNSKSPKLRGCYQWIENLDYISFANSVNQIEKIYMNMPHKNNAYNNDNIIEMMKELERDILIMYGKLNN